MGYWHLICNSSATPGSRSKLGRYLCEVRAGQYWRVEKLASFDDFLERNHERRFPESQI
jgi:hypothetical protein